MNETRHLNILVLPELFPEFDGDVAGIFIIDYLNAVHNYVTTNTLYIRLRGSKKGITDELFQDKFNVKRVVITQKSVTKILKPFLYILWLLKGYAIGKQYKKIDLIHVHGSILNGTLAYFLSKKLNVPFIVTEHLGPYSRILNHPIQNRIAKFVLTKAAKVLAVSEHQKNEILKLDIPNNKIEVSYNPVNTTIFTAKPQTDSKTIVFISRLDEFKGGMRTLQAFHQITGKHTEHQLIIAGNGEELNHIKSYIQKNNLTEKVTLMKTLTKVEMSNLFARCCFLVFPSRHETFGLVVAEALSCGLPVICTNKTAPKEFVNDKNGILVPPDNINSIANAMTKLITEHKNYNPKTLHAQIEQKFGLSNFGKYLVTVYKNVL